MLSGGRSVLLMSRTFKILSSQPHYSQYPPKSMTAAVLDAMVCCPYFPVRNKILTLPAARLSLGIALNQREPPHSRLSLLLESIPHLMMVDMGVPVPLPQLGSPSRFQSSLQDWLRPLLWLYSNSTIPSAQFCFFSLICVISKSIPNQLLQANLPWSLFPRELNLRQLLSSKSLSFHSHPPNRSFPKF